MKEKKIILVSLNNHLSVIIITVLFCILIIGPHADSISETVNITFRGGEGGGCGFGMLHMPLSLKLLKQQLVPLYSNSVSFACVSTLRSMAIWYGPVNAATSIISFWKSTREVLAASKSIFLEII